MSPGTAIIVPMLLVTACISSLPTMTQGQIVFSQTSSFESSLGVRSLLKDANLFLPATPEGQQPVVSPPFTLTGLIVATSWYQVDGSGSVNAPACCLFFFLDPDTITMNCREQGDSKCFESANSDGVNAVMLSRSPNGPPEAK